MTAYSILAKVDQIVTKEVLLLIEAETPEDAQAIAKEVLEVYPAPVPENPMVHRIVTKKIQHWIPRSIDFVATKEEADDEIN